MQCSCSQEITGDEPNCPICGMAVPYTDTPLEEPSDGAGEGDENTPHRNSRTARFTGVRAKSVVAPTGDNNTVFVEFNETINSTGAAEPSLLGCISNLTTFAPNDAATSSFLSTELRERASVLRENRFIVISCSEPSLARAAAAALIGELTVDPEQRKLLNFERLSAGMEPSIYQLAPPSLILDDEDDEMVVLADAMGSDRAQSFVDSLFSRADYVSGSDVSTSLSTAKLTLICLTDPDQLQGQAAASSVCWNLSYARFLLQQRFPKGYEELEAKIESQRKKGGWSSDAADFHKQLASLDTTAALVDAIAEGGINKVAAAVAPERYPHPEQPLQMAVLYTATFYPNLSPREFEGVLVALLGKQKQLVPETIQQKTKDGTFVPVELKRERELVQLWRERSDALLRECRLITAKDTKRAITFSDLGRRDVLRQHFEEEYGLYVQNQFCAAYDHGLLFDLSEQIARDVVANTVEMARNYPDHFGVEWLYEVVTTACADCPPDDARREAWTYERIADLLQPMVRETELESNVTGVLRRLQASAQHEFAFEIVRKLRFAPNFDAFHWLRQVLDQSSEEVRARAYRYLYNELKQPGRFYALLQTIEPWLPAADRDPKTYAPSQLAALRLVLEYCLETTMKFDARHYGAWPSRFPIVAVDAANAEERLGMIVRWLLHPGLTAAFGDQFAPEHLHRLIPALISEWTFILLAPQAVAVGAGSAAFGPAAALNVLVAKLIETSNASNPRELQKAMLAYWEEMKHFLAVAPATMGAEGRTRRGEFTWKRELVRKLVIQFRLMQRELRPQSPR